MLTWKFTSYAVPLFVGAGLMLLVVALSTRGKIRRVKVLLALGALLSITYAFGYALELGSQSLDAVRLWLKFQYLGITLGPVILLTLVLHLTGLGDQARFPTVGLLFVVPLITLGLVWSSEFHPYYWTEISIDTSGPFTRTIFGRNVWYYVQVGYSFFIVALMSLLLARAWWQSQPGMYRLQLLLLTIAAITPLLAFALYLSGTIFPGLDLNPYAQIVSYLLLAWGVLSVQLFDVVPVARETLIQVMADAVLVLDAGGRLVDFNPAGQHLIESSGGQARHGDLLAQMLPALAAQLDHGEPGDQQHIDLSLPQGAEERIYSASVSTLSGDSGGAGGRVLLLHDITERTRSAERLRTLREIEADLTRKLDLRFTVMLAVDAAQRLSGADAVLLALPEGERYRIEHAIGYPREVESQFLDAAHGLFTRALKNMEPDLNLNVQASPEYVALLPGMLAQITLPLPARDRPAGLLVLETSQPARFSPAVFEALRLLAARIASAVNNAQLFEERNQLLSDLDAFSHSVAHDLKAPLSVMIGYAELMKDDENLNLEQRDGLTRIMSTGFRASEIINALLLLAEVRKFAELPLEAVDMQETLQAALDHLRQALARGGAQLTLPSAPAPAVIGHRVWLTEVWTNLISNAIKYGGSPPQITIRWERRPEEGGCCFYVQDRGAGLSPEQIERLFKPFSRLDRSKEGHGLGLTIVQRMIQRLDGALGVESQPGQGSSFWFMLPLAREASLGEDLTDSP